MILSTALTNHSLDRNGGNKATYPHSPGCKCVPVDPKTVSVYVVAGTGFYVHAYSNPNCNPGRSRHHPPGFEVSFEGPCVEVEGHPDLYNNTRIRSFGFMMKAICDVESDLWGP
jgi:hypothetical protein